MAARHRDCDSPVLAAKTPRCFPGPRSLGDLRSGYCDVYLEDSHRPLDIRTGRPRHLDAWSAKCGRTSDRLTPSPYDLSKKSAGMPGDRKPRFLSEEAYEICVAQIHDTQA